MSESAITRAAAFSLYSVSGNRVIAADITLLFWRFKLCALVARDGMDVARRKFRDSCAAFQALSNGIDRNLISEKLNIFENFRYHWIRLEKLR